MLRRRDIIKSNGADYFKVFCFSIWGCRWCCLRVENNGWNSFSFTIPRPCHANAQIIPIFNFHCVWMQTCMNVKTDITTLDGISLECLFWLQFSMRRRSARVWEGTFLWRVVPAISCQSPVLLSTYFQIIARKFLTFLYIRRVWNSNFICIKRQPDFSDLGIHCRWCRLKMYSWMDFLTSHVNWRHFRPLLVHFYNPRNVSDGCETF